MKEQFVKLSDVKDILEEAGLITEYYYDACESVSGYSVDDVNNGLAKLPIYEFEDPDTQDKKTVEEMECAYKYISESESKDLELIVVGLDRLKKNGTGE